MKNLTVSAVRNLLVILSLFVCGCDQPSTKLTHGYKLERFQENGKYYVIYPADEPTGGGVFDGTIEEVGWDQTWIVARVTRLASCDTNGWYALNLKTKQITGPFQVISNTPFAGVHCVAPDEIGRQ
jgi:hypothetical protein